MDQENLNLTVSCSPHVHAPDGTRDIMLDVLIGLIPAMVGTVFFFGLRSLCVAAVSVAACIVFEFLYRKLLKRTPPSATVLPLSPACCWLWYAR